ALVFQHPAIAFRSNKLLHSVFPSFRYRPRLFWKNTLLPETPSVPNGHISSTGCPDTRQCPTPSIDRSDRHHLEKRYWEKINPTQLHRLRNPNAHTRFLLQ